MTTMKSILFLLTLIAMTTIIEGQPLIISDTTYKAGIYRTFKEFQNNNPSIDFSYVISTKNRGYRFLNESAQVTYSRIVIDKKSGKSIGKVFGFCDGKNVYINESLPRLGPKTEFSKIECFGNYCYFEDIIRKTIYAGTVVTSSCSLDEKIININTGEIIHLSKKTLRELIGDDSELPDEFDNESQKNKKLKEYFIKYMEKQ